MGACKHVYWRISTELHFHKQHFTTVERNKKNKKAAAKVKNAHENKKQTQARLLAPEEKKKKGEADCER